MLARPLALPLACALRLFGSVPSHAGTLRTLHVHVNGGQSIRVEVTNLGTKPLEGLTVTLTSPNGNVTTPFADLCAEGGPLPARNSCQVIYDNNQTGFATVTAKGKFSASIHIIGAQAENFTTAAVIPATK